jgi:hypothetical protein
MVECVKCVKWWNVYLGIVDVEYGFDYGLDGG